MAVPDLQDALDHLQQKDVEGAIATLERKVDELPAHLTAHVLLARAYESKRQWDKALTCWENVYFLMPNSPVAREGKQRVLRRMDRDSTAEEIEAAAPPEPAAPASADTTAPEATEAEAPESDTTETADETDDAAERMPATEAASELEQLRHRAETEARQGGARAGLTDPSDAPADADSPPTPEERVDQLESEDDDLDRLIDELESAQIDPDPDVDDVPEPDLDHEVDDLVSETLARIHEAQDDYRKAAQIYVKLASQEPEQARDHLEKAAEMRRQAERDQNEDA